MEYFKRKRKSGIYRGRSLAEITIHVRRRVGVKSRDSKVNGSEDANVSEMIKMLSMEKKNQHCDNAFSGTGHEPDGFLKLVECCKRYVCEETGCSPDWKDQELGDNRSDVRNVPMTRDHYAWRKKRSQEWRVVRTLSDIDDEFITQLLRIIRISSCFNSFVFNSWNTVTMETMWMWLTSMVFCPATW